MKISASRLTKFKNCPRRFVWNYLQDRREEVGTAAAKGTALHAYLEKGGDAELEIRTLAAQMQALLPDEPVVGNEVSFDFTFEDVEFTGIVDRLTTNTVIDYKTTSSDLKYAKTTKKLEVDEQRLIYKSAFADTTRSLWITGSWKSMLAVAHERKHEEKDKERFRLHVLQPAREILALDQNTDPLSLPLPGPIDPKTGVCEACRLFPPKGCQFVKDCFPDKKKTMRDVLKDLLSDKELVEASFPPSQPQPLQVYPPNESSFTQELKEPDPPPTQKYLIEELFIDCWPMHKLDTPLEYSVTFIKKASDEVAADLGVPSVLLVDFGRGPAMMVAQLLQDLEKIQTPIKYLHLDTKSAEGRALVQALSAVSRKVVRGGY